MCVCFFVVLGLVGVCVFPLLGFWGWVCVFSLFFGSGIGGCVFLTLWGSEHTVL